MHWVDVLDRYCLLHWMCCERREGSRLEIKGEGSESWLVRKWYRENYDRVEALVLQGLAIQSVSSIIGATLKRLDTAEPVFTWGVAEFCTIFVYVF